MIVLYVLLIWAVVALFAYLFLGPWILTWNNVTEHHEMAALVIMWPVTFLGAPFIWILRKLFTVLGSLYDRLEERRDRKRAEKERAEEERIEALRQKEEGRQPPFRSSAQKGA